MVINANQVDQVSKTKQNDQSEKTLIAQELRKIVDLKEMQKQLDSKAYESLKSDAKQIEALRQDNAYYNKLQKDPGIKILSNLATDLANMGIANMSHKTVAKSTTSKLNDEMEQLLNKSSLKGDKFEINNHVTQEAVTRARSKEERQEEKHDKKDTKQMMSSSEVKEAVHKYSGAFAQFVLAGSPEAKKKLEEAQGRLKDSGLSDREIIGVERSVKKSFRGQFISDIQDNFIQHMFSNKRSFDFVLTGRKLDESFKNAIGAGQLSGVSGDPEAVKEEMTSISHSSNEEIKDFIRDAVESKLMEKHLSDIDNRAQMKKLVEFGNRVGFNFEDFMKVWQQKKLDLGLVLIEIQNVSNAEQIGQISIGEVSAGGVGEKHGYELTKDEEKELLMNQLRAEFMKKALTGDPFAVFNFAPKIRKLKNGLIKLGLEAETFSRIEKEARALARYRTLEMLKEAFIERSTYYELSGPAYNLLNNKIKGLISNLEKLEMRLTREELDMLRDDANRQMYDHTIIELKSAQAVLENGDNPRIEQQVPLMVRLIQRLSSESGFHHGVGEDLDDIMLRHETGQKNIKGDA